MTLTNLIPDLYEGLDVVSRELTGLIGAVSTDNSVERVALNDTVRIPVTQSYVSAPNTPGVDAPDTGDQTILNQTMTIDHSKHVPIRWNGEQTKGYSNTGLFTSTLAQQTAQAIRTLVNEIETDIANEAIRASRAYGTAASTPFSTDLSDLANIRKILNDNGAPFDRQLVLNSAAYVNILGLTNLTQVNAAGTSQTLDQGTRSNLFGFMLHESAGIVDHTAGTASGATTDTAGYAKEATVITLADTGTGTIIAGDVVTFAGDTNKYVVESGTDPVAEGEITIAAPGLRKAIPAAATEISVSAAFASNLAFDRSAIQLATRAVALPNGGDKAIDSTMITDPRTGLSFEVALYPQYLQNVLHVRLAWGTKLIKPAHSAILLG